MADFDTDIAAITTAFTTITTAFGLIRKAINEIGDALAHIDHLTGGTREAHDHLTPLVYAEDFSEAMWERALNDFEGGLQEDGPLLEALAVLRTARQTPKP
jgi:hypothetical protein